MCRLSVISFPQPLDATVLFEQQHTLSEHWTSSNHFLHSHSSFLGSVFFSLPQLWTSTRRSFDRRHTRFLTRHHCWTSTAIYLLFLLLLFHFVRHLWHLGWPAFVDCHLLRRNGSDRSFDNVFVICSLQLYICCRLEDNNNNKNKIKQQNTSNFDRHLLCRSFHKTEDW